MPCLRRLEGGCSYDYIEVFDGPYHSSPLIARVCDNAVGSYTSSSNFMSVRFVSDSSVTRKGFQAEYYSRPSNDSTSKSSSGGGGLVRGGGTSESLLLLGRSVGAGQEMAAASSGHQSLIWCCKWPWAVGLGTLTVQKRGQSPEVTGGQYPGLAAVSDDQV